MKARHIVIPCFDTESRKKHKKQKELKSFGVSFGFLDSSFRWNDGKKGFTMLETLVAISIFTIASLVVFLFVRQGYQVQRFSFEGERAVASAQRGIETLIKEVREVLPSGAGAYPIELADPYQLVFFADFDRDNAVERVRYFIQGTTLKKGVIEPTSSPISYPSGNEVVTTLAEGVRNAEQSSPLFRFYNGDWPGDTVNNPLPPPANPTAVKLVQISLKIDVIPYQSPQQITVTSEVSLRNLKENL